jgi:hypothetical protein
MLFAIITTGTLFQTATQLGFIIVSNTILQPQKKQLLMLLKQASSLYSTA